MEISEVFLTDHGKLNLKCIWKDKDWENDEKLEEPLVGLTTGEQKTEADTEQAQWALETRKGRDSLIDGAGTVVHMARNWIRSLIIITKHTLQKIRKDQNLKSGVRKEKVKILYESGNRIYD